ncbi:MAG TPA: cytochrome c [Myxococcaceae bacterium]|nr:cytochrome c [Myxococcaceae bacterium]
MKQVPVLASIVAGSVLLSATALAQTDPKKVERAWKAKCSSCHGAAGKADTEKGKQMKIVDMTSPAFQAKKDDELKKAILDGVKKEKDGVKQEMDSFKGDLTPEQVDALIAYIRTFKK